MDNDKYTFGSVWVNLLDKDVFSTSQIKQFLYQSDTLCWLCLSLVKVRGNLWQ